MPVRLSMDRFCRLAGEVVDALPEEFKRRMENVVVDVDLWPTRKQLKSLGLDPDEETLFGLFEGVPYTEQDYAERHLNRVWLFKGPLEEACESVDELAYEIRRTMIHELAHHFGWSEED